MDRVAVFTLGERRFGLPLGSVERVIRAVAVTPLPQAPSIVCGVVNMQGQVIPVIDIRRHLGVQGREIALSDQLLVAHTPRRTLAMMVDAVTGVAECDERDWVAVETIVPGTGYLQGIVKLADEMVLIHDLDTFLSLDEEQSLEQALSSIA